MKKAHLASILAALPGFWGGAAALAAGDMTAQKAIEVRVELGDNGNGMHFVPDKLEFETGRLYKLVLHNPSPVAHYFSSDAFARAVFTRKAQVLGPDGKRIAEIKGSVSEIEVEPGGVAEWWFVPVKTITSTELRCTSKGHAEAGMVGVITIR